MPSCTETGGRNVTERGVYKYKLRWKCENNLKHCCESAVKSSAELLAYVFFALNS